MNKYSGNRYGKTAFSISGLIKLPVVLMRMKQLQSYLIRWMKSILPSAWVNQFRNQYLYWRYADTNRQYAAAHPQQPLPPLAFLAETFKPDYAAYFMEGKATAEVLTGLVKPHLPANACKALDWGCGTGRLTVNLQVSMPGLHWYGCDVRADMIQWNQAHLPHINFAVSEQQPPLPFDTVSFDLIVAFSVFTHIPSVAQEVWLKELAQRLSADGIIIFTTHGSAYKGHLSKVQQDALTVKGIWDNAIGTAGSRSRAIYHDADKFKVILEQNCTVLQHFDGAAYPELIGGQDIWICKKKVPQLRD